jgi:hypothetical protein
MKSKMLITMNVLLIFWLCAVLASSLLSSTVVVAAAAAVRTSHFIRTTDRSSTSSNTNIMYDERILERGQNNEEAYEDVDSGYITRAKCHSFIIQDDWNATLVESILDFNNINLFHVPTKSYMFYQYTDGDADLMMTDLNNWIHAMKSVKFNLTDESFSSCTPIESPQSTFWSSWKARQYLNIDMDAYFAETGNATDWVQTFYEGPICGLGKDTRKIDVGVFLDPSCTV